MEATINGGKKGKEIKTFRALFTGDLEKEGERALLHAASEEKRLLHMEKDVVLQKQEAWYEGNYDLLKVGHHGSSTSTSAAFLEWASPKMAVISCGRNNSYGHPHKETLECLLQKGCNVYRTDECGGLLVCFN